jgi:LysM repeat protein
VTHTVARGDTLWAISKSYDVTIEDIKSANGLTSDTIDVGQELIIPLEPDAVAASPSSSPASRSSPGRGRPSSGAPVSSAPSAPSAPSASPGSLSLPPERACLSGPTDVSSSGDEPAMVSSAGLSRAQITSSMDGFLGKLSGCVTGDWPSGRATYELTVACTGRVSRVALTDGGGLAPELVSCVSDMLRYVPFPAHDLPDGETFVYPVQFSMP